MQDARTVWRYVAGKEVQLIIIVVVVWQQNYRLSPFTLS